MTFLNAAVPDRFVGLDIGGTKMEAIVIDGAFRVWGHALSPTSHESTSLLVSGALATIYQALEDASVTPGQVAIIGIGIPGQVSRETGEVRHAANLALEDYPLGHTVSTEFGLPVVVENDVRAAAIGSYFTHHQNDVRNMAYVNIGTGVSAGLILDGTLYRGAHGMAGEIGHIIVDPGGVLCNCGMRGCLETLVAGPAIARQGEAAARGSGPTLLKEQSPVTPQLVYRAAAAGDVEALRIVEQAGIHLGRALQALIMSYDVERIVLGGGVTRAGMPFLQPILREWERHRESSPLAREMLDPDKLHLTSRDTNMVAQGVAAMAAQSLYASGIPSST